MRGKEKKSQTEQQKQDTALNPAGMPGVGTGGKGRDRAVPGHKPCSCAEQGGEGGAQMSTSVLSHVCFCLALSHVKTQGKPQEGHLQDSSHLPVHQRLAGRAGINPSNDPCPCSQRESLLDSVNLSQLQTKKFLCVLGASFVPFTLSRLCGGLSRKPANKPLWILRSGNRGQ